MTMYVRYLCVNVMWFLRRRTFHIFTHVAAICLKLCNVKGKDTPWFTVLKEKKEYEMDVGKE
jgi:hypothetical protein